MNAITGRLRDHYSACFVAHGPTPAGVDWGSPESAELRYAMMLAVIDPERTPGRPSLLDAGCGYAGLLDFAKSLGVDTEYTGVDVCAGMVAHARRAHPEAKIETRDLFDLPPEPAYDYVVCNGILTQKLGESQLTMARFSHDIVRRLYSLARHGLAINAMTTHANFYAPNLFYWSPVEALAFCLQLSPHVRLDHAYPLYEFTVYVYR
jgi:SAM-dependent methyltransferase